MSNHTTQDAAVESYVRQINQHRLLNREEETELAKRYRDNGDAEAARRLIESNLRFVVKVAHQYRGYNLPLLDLVQEGNIGLTLAVKKFDPTKGYRLISYAVWWIRAYIQNFIMASWSLVKVGTRQAQRKLFYKLRSERERADREAGPGATASVETLAAQLDVSANDISEMEARLSARDFSLDVELHAGSRETHLDFIGDERASQEDRLGELEERRNVRSEVGKEMERLNEKERYIITNRLMTTEPETLSDIGNRFRISRERARQIESNTIRKVRTAFVERGWQRSVA